jgi:hypothetical protein
LVNKEYKLYTRAAWAAEVDPEAISSLVKEIHNGVTTVAMWTSGRRGSSVGESSRRLLRSLDRIRVF